MSKVVHLSDDAHAMAKSYCKENGMKMSDWVASLIRKAIAELNAPKTPFGQMGQMTPQMQAQMHAMYTHQMQQFSQNPAYGQQAPHNQTQNPNMANMYAHNAGGMNGNAPVQQIPAVQQNHAHMNANNFNNTPVGRNAVGANTAGVGGITNNRASVPKTKRAAKEAIRYSVPVIEKDKVERNPLTVPDLKEAPRYSTKRSPVTKKTMPEIIETEAMPEVENTPDYAAPPFWAK